MSDSLFASGPTMKDAVVRQEIKQTDRESLDIWPYLILHLHTDQTASASTIKANANMPLIVAKAESRLLELRRDVQFIETWLAAAKRDQIDLIV